MKIHTTQNLSFLAQQQLYPTGSVSLTDIRFKQGSGQETSTKSDLPSKKDRNYKLINTLVLLSGGTIILGLSTALAKSRLKKLTPEDLKNTIKTLEEKIKVGDVKEEFTTKTTRWDKFLESKSLDKALQWTEKNEPVIQAAMAAFICMILRPLTIMSLPNKKGKEDNMYASAHSISSGIMGLVATMLIARPFARGTQYTMDKMFKDFSEDALKRYCPKLDLNSIYTDATKTARKEVKEWLLTDGNRFISNLKDVEKIPKLMQFNEISAKTFRELLHADVDWASQKGKSFNDVVTKDGKKLYDVIDWNNLGIIVKQEYKGAEKVDKKILMESTGDARILLKDLDREFLEKIIKDSDNSSYWKKLDINSVYKDGRVVDFRNWKELGTGNQWKLDLDNTYVSSPLDTTAYIPRISGRHRIEPTGEIKYAAYLKNGVDGRLGTPIDEIMMAADKKNDVLNKSMTWAPDIVTRPLVATATISLIPIALKNIFHIEKGKSAPAKPIQENKENSNVSFKGKSADDSDTETKNPSNSVSFKSKGGNGSAGGKKPSSLREHINKFLERFISKPLAKIYGKPMYESKVVNNVAEKLSRVPGGMTNHMATLGALLTSSVYMYQTLHKKDLDDDRKRTLAVNQCLCFIVPTICAYTVDKLLKNWTKEKIEYKYASKQEQKIALAKLNNASPEEIEKLQKGLGSKLKGVRTLVSLAIFALIYRYVAPVLITPVANRIGERVNEKKHAEKAQANA